MSPTRTSRQPLTAVDFYDGIQYHLGYFTTGEPVPGKGKGREETGGSGGEESRSQRTLRKQLTAMDLYAGKSLYGRGAVDSPFVLSAKGKPAFFDIKRLLKKSIGGIIKGRGFSLR